MSASFENYTFNGQTKEGLIRCNGEFLLITMDKSRQNITLGNSLQEAKEQTAPAQDTAKEPAESAKEETSTQEKPEESAEQKNDASEVSKDPKDPPQGPVGLFSHGTL